MRLALDEGLSSGAVLFSLRNVFVEKFQCSHTSQEFFVLFCSKVLSFV